MGLMVGDLKNCIDTTISINEYEPKIDVANVVVAFSCMDKEPAKDLNSFLSKSEIDFIDTEYSNIPDKDGKYQVFLELKNDKNTVKTITYVLEIIESLVVITAKEWYFTGYKTEKQKLSVDNLLKFFKK